MDNYTIKDIILGTREAYQITQKELNLLNGLLIVNEETTNSAYFTLQKFQSKVDLKYNVINNLKGLKRLRNYLQSLNEKADRKQYEIIVAENGDYLVKNHLGVTARIPYNLRELFILSSKCITSSAFATKIKFSDIILGEQEDLLISPSGIRFNTTKPGFQTSIVYNGKTDTLTINYPEAFTLDDNLLDEILNTPIQGSELSECHKETIERNIKENSSTLTFAKRTR